MKREEYIKSLIKEKGYTIKDFAKKIGMPYSTLLSILNNSVGGAALDNVFKICNALDITVDELVKIQSDSETQILEGNENEVIRGIINGLIVETENRTVKWNIYNNALDTNRVLLSTLHSMSSKDDLFEEIYELDIEENIYLIYQFTPSDAEYKKIQLSIYNERQKTISEMTSDKYNALFVLYKKAKENYYINFKEWIEAAKQEIIKRDKERNDKI